MTTPVDNYNKEEEADLSNHFAASNNWPLGSSSISLSVASGDVAMNSSIFSTHHLQESLCKDEVLVEKQDGLTPQELEEDVAEETKSVVSEEHEDINSTKEESGMASSSTILPFKPFWSKGFLKTTTDDTEDAAATEDSTKSKEDILTPSAEEEEEHTEETHLVEDHEEDILLEEVLETPTTAEPNNTNFTVFLENLRNFFRKEKFISALVFCKDQGEEARLWVENQWETTRHLIEPSLERPEFKATCCALLASLFLLGALSFFSTRKSTPLSSPKNDLKAFVLYEKSKSIENLQNIEELETDVFNAFARSACVKAETLNATRDALFSGLRGIPDNVRDDVVDMAVKEGVTQVSSLQDSKADIVDNGKAFSFMAFWSTSYDPKKKHHTYETCVMVTGVVLTVAETVAEWTLKQEKYQIGVQPCYCGM